MSKVRRGTATNVRSKRKVVTGAGGKSVPSAGRGTGVSAAKAKPAAAAAPAPTTAQRAPATKAPPGTAAFLSIGDEILRGEIANTNAAFISDRLFDAGFDVRSHLVVSDHPADIRAALELLAREASVIVATGGLGPTEDDRTVEVVCDLLGVEAAEDGPSLEAM